MHNACLLPSPMHGVGHTIPCRRSLVKQNRKRSTKITPARQVSEQRIQTFHHETRSPQTDALFSGAFTSFSFLEEKTCQQGSRSGCRNVFTLCSLLLWSASSSSSSMILPDRASMVALISFLFSAVRCTTSSSAIEKLPVSISLEKRGDCRDRWESAPIVEKECRALRLQGCPATLFEHCK